MKTIPLVQGLLAIVDDEDYIRVRERKWRIQFHPNGVIQSVITGSREWTWPLSNFILQISNDIIDHIDGDPLNNTRANLRVATQQQNCANRRGISNNSGYKGVCFVRGRKKPFMAHITVNYSTYHLGSFLTAVEAAFAYNDAAKKYFGSFAKLNEVTSTAKPEGNDTTVKVESN